MMSRLVRLCVSPAAEWQRIAERDYTARELAIKVVAPIAPIAIICSNIRQALFWQNRSRLSDELDVLGLVLPLVGLYLLFAIFAVVVFCLAAYLTNMAARAFNSTRNYNCAYSLLAFSTLPASVLGVLQLLPIIGSLAGLAGIYGLYLMHEGLPAMMKTPENQRIAFAALITVILIASAVLVIVVLTFVPVVYYQL